MGSGRMARQATEMMSRINAPASPSVPFQRFAVREGVSSDLEPSEARAGREYFFGSHDANRILFTRGRDIRLDPAQQGDPLNYFVYPYAELDGKPWTGIQSRFSFRDLDPMNASAASSSPETPAIPAHRPPLERTPRTRTRA